MNTIDELLKYYEFGQFVYPQTICRALKIDNYDISIKVKPYIDSGQLVEVYQIQCPLCNRNDEVYFDKSQIPDEIICEYCDEKIYMVSEYINKFYQKNK